MSGRAVEIVVSERQNALLEKWVRNKARTPHRLWVRCRIVLMSADGISNAEQGRRLGDNGQRPRRWRQRWFEAQQRLERAEQQRVSDRELATLMTETLSDRPRQGTPPTFSAEQLTQIIAIGCESPSDSGRPVTHWTPRELADEAIKRGVVESISPRHADRILKGGISAHTRPSTG